MNTKLAGERDTLGAELGQLDAMLADPGQASVEELEKALNRRAALALRLTAVSKALQADAEREAEAERLRREAEAERHIARGGALLADAIAPLLAAHSKAQEARDAYVMAAALDHKGHMRARNADALIDAVRDLLTRHYPERFEVVMNAIDRQRRLKDRAAGN